MIAIFAIFCAVGLPVIAIIVLIIRLTSTSNKERMAMINRGMIPPENKESAPDRLRTLRSGMGALGGGIGAVIGVVLLETAYQTYNEFYQFLVVMGSVALCFGAAFIIYYVISKHKLESED